jgi:Dipeptidyl aminopeptidases/acylaminoacyl-peptidases
MPNLTMTEEFEQDAFAAAKYLKTVNGIDASNITVLGHSEGGYDLPRILQSDKTGIFKAGIIMSGCSRPIYEVLPEQYKYLAGLGMATEQQAEDTKAQVAMIEDKSFDPANPPKGYTLGNAYYFNDMKNYDVIGTAKAIDKPVLVLQGERDYQVSPKTDYEGWKKAFEGKSNAEFKLYPKLNHMYTEREGQPTPAEYYVNSNIPQYVINDIATFVKK